MNTQAEPLKNDNAAATTVSEESTQTITNPLLNKKYKFSGNDLVIKGRWGIKSTVKMGSDRLNIQTFPSRKNIYPVVMLEDIVSIEEGFYMRTANIVLAVIGLLMAILSPAYLIIPALVLLLYREQKINIHLRNGNILTIYSEKKSLTSEFISDIKTVCKI